MPAILTPALASRYLRELSTDIRAAAVLDGAGVVLAGDRRLEPSARTLLAVLDGVLDSGRDGALTGGGREEIVVRVADGRRLRGTVVVSRGPAAVAPRAGAGDQHALVVAAGPHALIELLRHDVAGVLADLAAGSAEASDRAVPARPAPLPAAAAVAVASDASRCVQPLDPRDSQFRSAISAAAAVFAAAACGRLPSEDAFPANAKETRNR